MQSAKFTLSLRGFGLIIVSIAWLVGILLCSWVTLPSIPLFLGAAVVCIIMILYWHDYPLRTIALILCSLLFGAWRYSLAAPQNNPGAISHFIGTQKITMQGIVSDEPKLQGKSLVMLISVERLSLDNGSTWQDASGKLQIQTSGSGLDNPYGPNYGDSVEVQGNLLAPSQQAPPDVFASMCGL